MSKNRNIAVIGQAKVRTNDHGFRAANVSSASVGTDIEPVISIDHFHIREPKFPPHPHAGFMAITYLFEDGEGEFVSRDSTGGQHIAQPGGVIWNVAGSGVIHEEYPKVKGELSHGLQTFINLPAEEKMQEPHVLFVDGPDMPVFVQEGVKVRVVAGEIGDVKSKIAPPGNITYLDIQLAPNAIFQTIVPMSDHVILFMIKGRTYVGDNNTQLSVPNAASLDYSGTDIVIKAAEEGAQVVLIAGKPNKEPVVSYGPFIMNNEAQIEEAIQRYRSGKMGNLEAANNY